MFIHGLSIENIIKSYIVTTDSNGEFSIQNIVTCYGISSSSDNFYCEYTIVNNGNTKVLKGRIKDWRNISKVYTGTFEVYVLGYVR